MVLLINGIFLVGMGGDDNFEGNLLLVNIAHTVYVHVYCTVLTSILLLYIAHP